MNAERRYRLLSSKNIKVLRPTVFPYIHTQAEFDHYTEELFGLLKAGQLKVRIHKVYPLEEIAQAHIVSPTKAEFCYIIPSMFYGIFD